MFCGNLGRMAVGHVISGFRLFRIHTDLAAFFFAEQLLYSNNEDQKGKKLGNPFV